MEHPAVLSVWKLAVAHASYYEQSVTDGREDYYVGSGEAPGRWMGTLAAELSLDGRVDGADLHAMFDGRDPRTGERFVPVARNRVAAFDLTFNAPKSVSVLFALGNNDHSRAVRAAHDAAVAAALEYVQRDACWVRLGTGGYRLADGSGFVAAAFRHRTSRAGDPHLHTHVLVANMTRRPDGRWAALDGRQLYAHAKTAGYLYEAALRHEITARLGLDWGPVRNGIADLAGIPEQLCSAFSSRRREIQDELARLGLYSARAAQTATLNTRRPKDRGEDISVLHSRWREQTRRSDSTPTDCTHCCTASIGLLHSRVYRPKDRP